MLHATRRRTPPLSAALATAFFASKPQPPPLVSPRLVDAAVSRCPSDALALSFFLWCARRPAYLHPPASFDRILPAATRLASRLRTAPALLRELRAVGCPIRPHTFLLLLRLYWRGGLYPLVLQLFDQMPLWGFQPNVFALNVALDVHLRTGRLDAALRLLRERDKPSPNYLTYAIFVTHLSRAGDWSGVRNCFISMLQQGFLPSAASLASVFTCCSKAGTMSELLQLLSFTLVSGNQLNSAMWTCFIARICREGRLDEACRMLAKMLNSGSSPTVVTYTPLVKGLFRAGRHDKVHELLGSMASTGCSPDLVFYNVLMDCMMKERRYDYALYIYLNLHRHGIKPDAYTLSTLVQVLQLSHNMVLLPRLILGTGISYDLVACNSMLSALCKSGFPSEAIQFYIDMVDVGFRPDSYSYVRCLDSLCQLGRIDHAKSFYYSIVDPNTYVHASILRGLVRSGKNRMALKIFREAVRQNCALDAVCYTIVLHGLFQAHLVEEACKLFDKMKLLGMASNTCIYNVMLRGLCRTRDMHAVTQLLGEMESAGVQMDSISFNILVVLLIKLQRISSATTLVREMLNLGMKLSTKTHWLLSQSIGHAFIVEDATISESDASDSTSDLLASGAWLLYKSNTREENFLFATLKGFSVLDDREGTQDELRLAIGKSATVRDTSSVDGYDNPNELDSGELRIQKDLGIEPIPSMLILDAILRKTSSSVSLCVQRPKFLVALDFLLAIVEFFVPSARSLLSNDEDKDLLHMISPVVFHDQLYHQEQSTFSLSPQNPLIVDNEKFDHFIYDGKGGKLYLQDREGKILSCPSAESFIHVLGGKSLQFRNVTIVNGEYLDSCISLGSDCWYSASEDDHVYLVRENDGLPSTLNEEIAEDVVENASADRSTEFIMELQAIGPELTFYSTSRNAGENLALSTKVIHARTDVFCR